MSERILEAKVQEQYIKDMCLYSIISNRKRALPQPQDGLKPVQRRDLYAMLVDVKCVDRNSKIKSATIVGDVMGKYHPHGDSSTYGALTPLANWFNTRYPLITSRSNMGSIEGEGAAAMRYTECYLSQFSMDVMMKALSETPSIVDWTPTFDNKHKEPDFLPAKIPVLLCNGSFGIGTGIKIYIPPHNINEVIDATIRLMNDPSYNPILIPDFPLPCHIVDTNWKKICNTGNGKFYVRANIDIIDNFNGQMALEITSLPDMVSAIKIKEKINEMIADGQLPMVTGILSESNNRDGLAVYITLKNGSDPYYVRDILYNKTDCQKDYTVNFEVANGTEVIRMSYKSYLEFFINFAIMNKFRYFHNKNQKALTEFHKLDAYIKIIRSGEMDKIIAMIRKAKQSEENELIEYLVNKLKITDIQAKYILQKRLQDLSAGSLDKYVLESQKILERKEYYEKIICSEDLIKQEVVKDLLDMKKKYGDARKCDVIKVSVKDNIPPGTFNVVVTEKNFIRKIPENTNINIVKGDKPNFALKVDNTESILIFDNKGKVYKVPVHQIPISDKQNPGLDLRFLIKGFTADVSAVLYEPVLVQIAKNRIKHYITIVTENNYCKKMDLEDFINCPPSGIFYAKLTQGDSVKSVDLIADPLDIIIYSQHKALRFPMKDIPLYKRITQGVSAMNTKDKIEGLSIVFPDATSVIVITKSGRVNKFSISGLATSSRNKAGSNMIKLGKQDEIVSVYGVNDSNVLHIVTTDGVLDIPVSDIPLGSSVSQGERLINGKGNIVIKTVIK